MKTNIYDEIFSFIISITLKVVIKKGNSIYFHGLWKWNLTNKLTIKHALWENNKDWQEIKVHLDFTMNNYVWLWIFDSGNPKADKGVDEGWWFDQWWS